MLTLCRLYFRLKDNPYIATVLHYLRFVVIGLIAAAALSLMNSQTFIDYWSYVLFGIVFLLTLLTKVNPMLLICLCGVAGFFIYS